MDSVSVIIATFGDDKWKDMAYARALPSVQQQVSCDEIVMIHQAGGTAATCKNAGIEKAKGPWIVICDADDQLEMGYVAAMKKGTGDLRYPKVRIIKPNHPVTCGLPDPIVIDQCSGHLRERNLLMGNFMVVGTAFRKEDFIRVGGFKEWETWEDYELFLRMSYAGAVPKLCPGAVYRVFQHAGSRVSQTSDPSKLMRSMHDSFREWAYEFNGGVTSNPHYQAFLAKSS
jgi:glycosyltransferase involved in cell wall biosynthesis